ncbi:HEAT repeat domain-containing protein [Serratia marcescens]|uniref:HEAT repeat domain-containing protein n=1 Tax=Serratia marcescens TaxID=615 RepID=UPI0014617038|nr:HEAT repeat domain-containing protein [Serratia marcescens]MBH2705894.1 HEAT repeat domain-containing protein [Serratia marcescens]MBH2705906.1 HEAT repeat domain-containing protein [Serratia marcescens]MBH3187424.1 HEAT repeat domain-containing protein [Serratia marcescens]NMQ35724.1 hypothetical protein [Serratia marcescens]
MKMSVPVVNTLLALTDDSRTEVRTAAIFALGEGRSEYSRVLRKFLSLTSDPNEDIKIAAINA